MYNLLRSLAEDGKGLAGREGSLELMFRSRDRYRVRVLRSWPVLEELAERRRAPGDAIVTALCSKAGWELPTDGSGKVLVEFGLEDLTAAIQRNLTLKSLIRDPLAAAERGLLFLHEHGVVQLQNGLAVFRQAMTLRVLPEAKGRRYTAGDYQPLEHHYGERTFQIHVMARYADLALEKIRSALDLIHDYFHLAKEGFVDRHFADEKDIVARATGRESYRGIVDSLANPRQIALVAAPANRNLLVLAGPGSGKTRVVVHRCAYLLRLERVPARRIVVLCFNRNAAYELRRRLRALVGDDARGVTVQTYHGLAMLLTGTSFATLAEATPDRPPDFDHLISDALRLLTDDRALAELPLEPDELREQLLAGASHILVDEYQDVNQDQYELVSALAGRRERDRDRRLAILAVGDDDQNIYGFAGADVEFIRRYRDDYRAEVHHLVENYRSAAHVIACANRVIAANQDRMKRRHPIVANSFSIASTPSIPDLGEQRYLSSTAGKSNPASSRTSFTASPSSFPIRAIPSRSSTRLGGPPNLHRQHQNDDEQQQWDEDEGSRQEDVAEPTPGTAKSLHFCDGLAEQHQAPDIQGATHQDQTQEICEQRRLHGQIPTEGVCLVARPGAPDAGGASARVECDRGDRLRKAVLRPRGRR